MCRCSYLQNNIEHFTLYKLMSFWQSEKLTVPVPREVTCYTKIIKIYQLKILFIPLKLMFLSPAAISINCQQFALIF